MIADLIDHFLCRGCADIGLRAGPEPLGDLGAHLDDALGLRHGQRLRVGIGDDEIDALQSGGDHVVDGIAAGPAYAEYRDPRLQLANVRDVEIDSHGCLSITRALVRPGRRPRELVKVEWAGKDSSEALTKPSSDFSEIAVSPCSELPRMPRFDVFKMSVLGIDQEPGGNREGRALRLVGQPAEAERATDSDRPVEDPGGKLKGSGELRSPAAQYHSRLWFCRKGRIREPVPDHFKNLLGTMPDNVRDRGT